MTLARPSNSSPPASCLKNKRLHIRLRPSAESQVRSGHPWIFADSVREQSRDAPPGELAIIFDRKNEFLALGLYDPASPLRVRIIHRGRPIQVDAGFWRTHLQNARRRRAGILDPQTNAVRWINGESDSFPGLVLDQYDRTLVLKLYSAIWFSRLDEIISLLRDEFHPERLVLRLSRNIQTAARQHSLTDPSLLIGSPPEAPVIFLESGLRFEADVLRGQKTGFFLDQRENRRIVGTLSAHRDVLNAFSFSGGFSLYAARGGARRVTDVDISAHALESSRRNFALNPDVTASCDHRLIQADVFEWLRKVRHEKFDLVILDPPSLAKRAADRAPALHAYANLAESGVRLLRPGAVLVCCSCSAHIRAAEFFDTVQTGARRANGSFTLLQTTREPPDHHSGFAEAEYLKAIYLQFQTVSG